jgi:hypothetical protein
MVTGTVLLPSAASRAGNVPDSASHGTALQAGVDIALIPSGVARVVLENRTGAGIRPITTRSGAGGTFQFKDVGPGIYRLFASATHENRRVTAVRDISIQAGNTEKLTLALEAGIDISGRLDLTGQLPPGFQMRHLSIGLGLLDGGGHPRLERYSSEVEPDEKGSFVFHNVMPDARYEVTLGSDGCELDRDIFVSASSYGGADGIKKPITVRKGAGSLVLQLDSARGRVEVTAMDRGGPQKGRVVLLAPAERRRIGFYKTETSDDQGRVAFSRVRPGDYEVYAWESVVPDSWNNPRFLDQFEGFGRRIRVENDRTKREAVQVINVERGSVN